MFWDFFGSVRSLFWYRLGRSVSKVARGLEGAPEKFLALGNGRFGRAAKPSDVSRIHWDRGKEAWKVRRIYSEKGTRKFRAKATVQVWSRYGGGLFRRSRAALKGPLKNSWRRATAASERLQNPATFPESTGIVVRKRGKCAESTARRGRANSEQKLQSRYGPGTCLFSSPPFPCPLLLLLF